MNQQTQTTGNGSGAPATPQNQLTLPGIGGSEPEASQQTMPPTTRKLRGVAFKPLTAHQWRAIGYEPPVYKRQSMEAMRAMTARFYAIMPDLYALGERWQADYVAAHKCEPTDAEWTAAAQQIFDQLWSDPAYSKQSHLSAP